MLRILSVLLSVLLLTSCAWNVDVGRMADQQQAARYNVQLGLGYLQEGQTERAKQKLLLALRQAPRLAEVQTAMGYFLLSAGELEQAKMYYQRALALAPQAGEVQNNYGVFLCHIGQHKLAVQHFLLAAKDVKYFNDASVYENAGLCALKIPDRRLASQFFLKALRYDKNRGQSLLAMARISIDDHQPTKARRYIEQYLVDHKSSAYVDKLKREIY